jgi:hypothetical protein
MTDYLDGEQATRESRLAMEILTEFENEGEDPTLIFSVFAIGSSVCAQLHEVKKEKYLEHCGNFYDDATEFLTDMEVLGDKDES